MSFTLLLMACQDQILAQVHTHTSVLPLFLPPATVPPTRRQVPLLHEMDEKTLYLLASKMTPFRWVHRGGVRALFFLSAALLFKLRNVLQWWRWSSRRPTCWPLK